MKPGYILLAAIGYLLTGGDGVAWGFIISIAISAFFHLRWRTWD